MTKKKAKAPGKYFRKGLTLMDLMKTFPDDATARKWFEGQRWPNGPCCPYCGSLNVQEGTSHRTMTHRCRDCPDKRFFSLKSRTIMESSKLSYRVWAIAIYLHVTSLKGVSSMKLHRDLGITQKTAWFVLQRIRKAWESDDDDDWPFGGPIEVDETYIGGKERNKHESQKLRAGRGMVGKTAIVGIKDRETNRIRAEVVEATNRLTLHGFIADTIDPLATVYTDSARVYLDLPFHHEYVNHSIGEYVRQQAHTNGIESFWAMLKRGYYGTYHRMSVKHLQRYVDEFAGRRGIRMLDTIDQMQVVARRMVGKRLRYQDLIS